MDSKYILMIDNEKCYIPESVIKELGEDNFIMLSSDIEASKRYEILKKLDYVFSNYVTMSADEKYFKGRGMEYSMYDYNAKRAIEKGDYDAANILLYKSIKAFYDIHRDCIKEDEEMRNKSREMRV